MNAHNMIRSTEDTVFEYDPDNNKDDNINNENSTTNNDSLLGSYKRSIYSNEQIINGNLIKTDNIKLIQALSQNENIKISRLKSSLSTEDINGSLIRIKSDISEIEDNIKAYESINKQGSESNSYLNIRFFDDSKSLLNEIEEMKMNLNNLIEKQKLFETTMNSMENLKQQNISNKDVIDELSNVSFFLFLKI